MSVRLANNGDAELIKKIHKESNKEIGSFNLFYIWDKYIDGSSKYKYYIIEGKAFMRYGFSKMMKCYTIKEVGILNEFKGQGLAKEFFKVVKSPMCLYCNSDNDSGNRFYEKMGMRLKGTKLTKNQKKTVNVWVI